MIRKAPDEIDVKHKVEGVTVFYIEPSGHNMFDLNPDKTVSFDEETIPSSEVLRLLKDKGYQKKSWTE